MRKLLPLVALIAVASLTSAPVPKNLKGPGTIYVWTNSQPPVLNLYTPDGEHIKEVKFGTKKECEIVDVSPGGKYVVVTSKDDKPDPVTGVKDTLIHLVSMADTEHELPEPIVSGQFEKLCWSADSRTAYITMSAGVERFGRRGRNFHTFVFEYDLATGRKQTLGLGSGHEVRDVSADGRAFLTTTWIFDPDTDKSHFAHIIQARTGDTQPLHETEHVYVREFHPDGKRVFARQFEKQTVGSGSIPRRSEFLILDPETGKAAPLEWAAALKKATQECLTSDWSLSTDRKRVVVKWNEPMQFPRDGGGTESRWVDRLGVCDLDGQNFKVIFTAAPEVIGWRPEPVGSGFAWR